MRLTTFEIARQLQAISQTGLEYVNNQFDRERYEQVAGLAMDLMSRAMGEGPSAVSGAFVVEKG